MRDRSFRESGSGPFLARALAPGRLGSTAGASRYVKEPGPLRSRLGEVGLRVCAYSPLFTSGLLHNSKLLAITESRVDSSGGGYRKKTQGALHLVPNISDTGVSVGCCF